VKVVKDETFIPDTAELSKFRHCLQAVRTMRGCYPTLGNKHGRLTTPQTV